MHIPTLIRKRYFALSGALSLSDSVRNTAYRWAWGHLRYLSTGAIIIDIGSRDSLFPSFLAWRGFFVRVVERDARFYSNQKKNSRNWNVRLVFDNCDFLAATLPGPSDAICSIFSLQHAGDDDIPSYRSAARWLRPGGLFLSAIEYRHRGTSFHYGRDDGTMRVHGPDDVAERIVAPLSDGGMVETERQVFGTTQNGKIGFFNDTPGSGMFMLQLFKKMRDAQDA